MAERTEAEAWTEQADKFIGWADDKGEQGQAGIGCAVLALAERLAEFMPVAERAAVALERIAAVLESANDELDGGT